MTIIFYLILVLIKQIITIGIVMVVLKVVGAGVLLLGAALTFVFPFILDYQPKPIANGGRLLGLIVMAIGIYLLFTG